jgi:hypothetical protein
MGFGSPTIAPDATSSSTIRLRAWVMFFPAISP